MRNRNASAAALATAWWFLAGAAPPAPAPPDSWSVAHVDSVLARDRLGAGDTLRVTVLGSGAHSTAVLIQLAAGARVPGHVHREHDETVWIVRGEASLRIGGAVRRMGSGDLACVPQGTPHGAVAGPAGCVAVAVYAPLWDPADRHRDPRGDP